MNYKESTISGTSWQRAYAICISNQLNQIPSIVFSEEEILDANGTTYQKNVGQVSESIIDPSTSFDLLNPNDGSVIGTATYQDLQVMLFSLYINLVTKRDMPS